MYISGFLIILIQFNCIGGTTSPLFRRSAIPTRNRVRFRDRVRARVSMWIVCYMDAQTVAMFGIADRRNSGWELYCQVKSSSV